MSGETIAQIGRLECRINEIHEWLTKNRLRLNQDKTELTYCFSARHIGSFLQLSLSVGSVAVLASDHVRDLGVLLLSDLSTSDQIKADTRSCFCNIRQLRAIKSSWTCDALRDVDFITY